MTRKNVDGSSMVVFVVNVRDGGKCHLASASAMSLPKQKRRSLCGWRYGSAVSLATNATVNGGHVCRKCFPTGIVQKENCDPIVKCE